MKNSPEEPEILFNGSANFEIESEDANFANEPAILSQLVTHVLVEAPKKSNASENLWKIKIKSAFCARSSRKRAQTTDKKQIRQKTVEFDMEMAR